MTTKIYEIKGGRNFLPRSTNLPSELMVNRENGDYTVWLNQDITANGHSCWVIIGRQTEEECRNMLLDIIMQPDVHGYEEVELSDLINLILVDPNGISKFNSIMDDLHTYDVDALDLGKVLEDYEMMSAACDKHDIEPKLLDRMLTDAQDVASIMDSYDIHSPDALDNTLSSLTDWKKVIDNSLAMTPDNLKYLLGREEELSNTLHYYSMGIKDLADILQIVCNHKQRWHKQRGFDETTSGEEEQMLDKVLDLGWIVKDYIETEDDCDDGVGLVALLCGLKVLGIRNANTLQTWAIEQAGIDPYADISPCS